MARVTVNAAIPEWCRHAVLCVTVLFAPIAAPALAEEAPAKLVLGEDASFENGMRALVEDDFFRAATIFNTMLRRDPHDGNAYIGLSEVQVRGGHLEEAEAWLLRGIAVRPGDGNLYRARAHVASLRHRNAEAASFLSRALVLDPRNAQDEAELARLYAGPLNDPALALTHYRAAVALAPTDASLQYDYAILLVKQRRTAEALPALARAQRLAPLNPLPSFVAARLRAEQGATSHALAMLDATLRIRPGLAAAEQMRGDLLRRAGRPTEAAASYRAVLRQEPESIAALEGLALASRTLGRNDDAVPQFKAVLARDPANIAALDGLARIGADRKQNLEQAAVWSRRAIVLRPGDATLRDTLGWVHLQNGQPALAEQALREGLKLRPSASLYYHLGLAAAGQGKMTEAQQFYARALALQPWLAEAQTALWALAEKAADGMPRAKNS